MQPPKLFLLLPLLWLSLTVKAQDIDTLKPGYNKLDFTYLKPGVEKFILYNENKQTYHTPGVLWVRKVELHPDSGIIKVIQKQVFSDTTKNAIGVSSVSINNFKPVQFSHISGSVRLSTLFKDNAITLTMDSLKTNKSKLMNVAIVTPAYDFEADEELFKILPLKEGYKIRIPFYQPNTRGKTKYYLYEVAGTDFLTQPGGSTIECWKFLSPDYTGGTSVWWIAKKTHEVLRQERLTKDGGKSVKELI